MIFPMTLTLAPVDSLHIQTSVMTLFSPDSDNCKPHKILLGHRSLHNDLQRLFRFFRPVDQVQERSSFHAVRSENPAVNFDIRHEWGMVVRMP